MENISYACSDDYHIFVSLGYPQLDRITYCDGEWAIREFYNRPIIPSLTKWRVVFSGFRNIEFSYSFVKKMIEMIDNQKEQYWRDLDKIERDFIEHDESIQRSRVQNAMDVAERLMKKEKFMEAIHRIGRNAFKMENIIRGLPREHVTKALGPNVKVFC